MTKKTFHHDLQPGDALVVGGPTLIRLVEKSGRRARLRIEAEEQVPIRKVPNGR